MCRLMAYYGDEMLLARSLMWPDRSIIRQSYDARERLLDPSLPAHLGHGNLNADGFGIGWYGVSNASVASTPCPYNRTPCTFKSITPAWNNDNLARLAEKICSPLMFAHVRAAYPGMPVSEQNVRPKTCYCG
jgi:glutamine amidotransferase